MLRGRIRYEEVHWGVHGCHAPGCWKPGEVIWDDSALYCLEHCDELLERQELASSDPDFVAKLQPFGLFVEKIDPFRQWRRNEETGEIEEVKH